MNSAKTWTMAQAKSDFDRGLLRGTTIHFYEIMGECNYTVTLDSTLALDGSGDLIDARTKTTRQFKTMDAAHSAIRQIGFRTARFVASLK